MTVMIVGDSPVLAQSLEQGGIEATISITHGRALKEKGFPVLLDLGKRRFLSGAGSGDSAWLSQAKSPDRRFIDARLCRNRGVHSQTWQ
jgi:hypothetical protein